MEAIVENALAVGTLTANTKKILVIESRLKQILAARLQSIAKIFWILTQGACQ